MKPTLISTTVHCTWNLPWLELQWTVQREEVGRVWKRKHLRCKDHTLHSKIIIFKKKSNFENDKTWNQPELIAEQLRQANTTEISKNIEINTFISTKCLLSLLAETFKLSGIFCCFERRPKNCLYILFVSLKMSIITILVHSFISGSVGVFSNDI